MEKDNKLIAEFMGGVLSPTPNLINLPQTRGDANIHSVKGSYVLPNGTYSVHRLNELKYHNSWDWLMPVVAKIENYLADNMGRVGYFDDCLNSNDLEARYQSVVEFIKFYNAEKTGELYYKMLADEFRAKLIDYAEDEFIAWVEKGVCKRTINILESKKKGV